jgi:hypothetical protein
MFMLNPLSSAERCCVLCDYSFLLVIRPRRHLTAAQDTSCDYGCVCVCVSECVRVCVCVCVSVCVLEMVTFRSQVRDSGPGSKSRLLAQQLAAGPVHRPCTSSSIS